MPFHEKQLTRKGKKPVKRIPYNIPLSLYGRMVKEGRINPEDEPGLGWGEITKFLNMAVEEKLDRDSHKTKGGD